MRLFLAIPVDQRVLDALEQAVVRLRESRAAVRWVRPEGMHLTLKFLGETDTGLIQPLVEALAVVSRNAVPFTMTVSGTGAYPSLRRPRVLWAGVREDSGSLHRLWSGVEAAAGDLGWERERRKFSPHITIGRVKGSMNLGRLARSMEEMADRHWGEQDVGEMTLYRSTLGPGGAVYEKVHLFRLGQK